MGMMTQQTAFFLFKNISRKRSKTQKCGGGMKGPGAGLNYITGCGADIQLLTVQLISLTPSLFFSTDLPLNWW